MSSFIGIPIDGDVIRESSASVPQQPIEDFRPILLAILADPYIRAVGWYQYTPRFNDGDPCIFHARGVWVQTVDDPERSDWENEWTYEVSNGDHPSLGHLEYQGVGLPRPYVGEHPDSYALGESLMEAVEGGAFDHVLLEAFGDSADVEVTREGIVLSRYEHD